MAGRLLWLAVAEAVPLLPLAAAMLLLSSLRPGRALRRAATSCRLSTGAAPPALRRPDQPLPVSSPAQRPAGPREARRQQAPGLTDPQPPGLRRAPQGLGRAEELALREAVLVAALRSRLFYEAPQERFVRRLAGGHRGSRAPREAGRGSPAAALPAQSGARPLLLGSNSGVPNGT